MGCWRTRRDRPVIGTLQFHVPRLSARCSAVATSATYGNPRESFKKLKEAKFKTFLLLAARQWRNHSLEFDMRLLLVQAAAHRVADRFGWRTNQLCECFASIATMWFGCSNGAQQIVSE